MIEIPEAISLSKQLNGTIKGKTISKVVGGHTKHKFTWFYGDVDNYQKLMVNNKIDHAMVAAINEVGHIMGIKTIAEHVENDQIIKKLQALNVDYGQGYGIEQPRPIREVISFGSNTPLLQVVNKKA